jgi:hypothetical protein
VQGEEVCGGGWFSLTTTTKRTGRVQDEAPHLPSAIWHAHIISNLEGYSRLTHNDTCEQAGAGERGVDGTWRITYISDLLSAMGVGGVGVGVEAPI